MFLTELIAPRHPGALLADMRTAIIKEVQDVIEWGAFRVVLREEFPADANCMPGRIALAERSTEDGSTKFKARFVICGHPDRLKHYMLHSSITVQPSSIRLLRALTAMFAFDVWSSGETKAHLQSTGELGRDIYITKVAPELELERRRTSNSSNRCNVCPSLASTGSTHFMSIIGRTLAWHR